MDTGNGRSTGNNTCSDVNRPCFELNQIINAARMELSVLVADNGQLKLSNFHMKIMMKGTYQCNQLFDFSNYTNKFELSWIGMTESGFYFGGCNALVVDRMSVIDKFHFVKGEAWLLSLNNLMELVSFEHCKMFNLAMSSLNVKNIAIIHSDLRSLGLKDSKVGTLQIFDSKVSELAFQSNKIDSVEWEYSTLDGYITIEYFESVKISNCDWKSTEISYMNAGNVLNITNTTIPKIHFMLVSQVILDTISLNQVNDTSTDSYLNFISSNTIVIRNWTVTNSTFYNLISAQKLQSIQILNCIFNNNNGRIFLIREVIRDYSARFAQVALRQSKFISNVVQKESTIVPKDNSIVSISTFAYTGTLITECEFRNNVGTSIQFDGNGFVVSKSLFIKNVAEHGGAIRATGKELSINYCSLIGNQANKGGAIYLTNLLRVAGSSCENNIAQVGGCIYSSNSKVNYEFTGKNSATYYGNDIGSDLVGQTIELRGNDGEFKRMNGESIEIYPGEPLSFKLFIYDRYNQNTSKLSNDYSLTVTASSESVILQKQDYQAGDGFIMLENLQILLVNNSIDKNDFQLRFSVSGIISLVNVKIMSCPSGYSFILGSTNYYSCQAIPFEVIIPSVVFGIISLTIIFAFSIFVIITVMKKLLKLRKQEKAEKRIENQFKNKHFVFGNGIESLQLLDNSLTSETPEQYIIPISEITIKKKIGEGASGIVYQGLWNRTDVAIKQFKTDTDDEEFEREAVLMSSLRHPSIVSCYGVSLSSNSKYMIVEYLSNGGLDKAIYESKIGKKKLKFMKKLNILNDICKGMVYLHSIRPNKIIHRDLKCANILLDKNMNAKVGDFGLSKIVNGNSATMTTNIGTLLYIAPELLSNHHRGPTTKIDVYSFGIILWELLHETIPFSDELSDTNTVFSILMDVVKGHRPRIISTDKTWIENNISKKEIEKYGIEKLEKSLDDYLHIMKECWNNEPNERPEFIQISESLDQILTYLNH